MKKLIILGLLIGAGQLPAATVVKTITGANAGTNILSAGFHLMSLALTDVSGTNNPIRLFDSPSSAITVVRAAYTNSLTYSTNITVITTSFNGQSQTNIYAAVYTTPNVVAAVTNSYNSLGLITVPASSTVTLAPLGGIYPVYGLTLTNFGTFNFTLTYSSTL